MTGPVLGEATLVPAWVPQDPGGAEVSAPDEQVSLVLPESGSVAEIHDPCFSVDLETNLPDAMEQSWESPFLVTRTSLLRKSVRRVWG